MTIWRPFTQMKKVKSPPKVTHGKGLYLYPEGGKPVMDMISSWWVTLHGHGREEIQKAISEQALRLEQVIFANFSHSPAEELTEKLSFLLPPSLSYFFFSDNGSTAVEVAIKMSLQYWHNLGEKRDLFIAFEGGYHGDTIGAMSVSSPSSFTSPFQKHLFQVSHIPYPETWEEDLFAEEKEKKSIDTLLNLIEKNEKRLAGIIIEPLIQGAGGMRICKERFLKKLEKIAKAFSIPLIYDEVMTGFGRTGDFFACNKSSTTPDIICLSKGITGGFLPLSLTVASKKIYDAFYSDDPKKAFLHGHSYTANPIACAAAVASLDLLTKEKAFLPIEAWHEEFLLPFKNHPKVEKIRVCGTIAAMNIVPLKREEKGYFSSLGNQIQNYMLNKGIFIRPLGDALYLLPPYCIQKEELKNVYQTLYQALNEIS